MKKIQTYPNQVYNVVNETTDYLNYVTRTSTPAQRAQYDIGDLFLNAVVCVRCKDYVRSRNRHDFRMCSCNSVGVDGGSWYGRLIGQLDDMIIIQESFYTPNNNTA